MTDRRRKLIEGVKAPPPGVDPGKEKDFVYSGKTGKQTETPAPSTSPVALSTGNSQARVPISTRMRADLATALKRASLERQLEGIEPNTLQDILEQAVEPWLRSSGYLK
jgi:hypothetical protein